MRATLFSLSPLILRRCRWIICVKTALTSCNHMHSDTNRSLYSNVCIFILIFYICIDYKTQAANNTLTNARWIVCCDWITRQYSILEILRSALVCFTITMRVCVWHGKSFRCFCPFFIFLNGFIYNIRMVEKNAKKKAHRIQTFGRRAHTHNAVRIGHLHLIKLNGIVTYDLQFQKWTYTQIHAWHFTLITLLLHVNAPLPFALSFSLIPHLSP